MTGPTADFATNAFAETAGVPDIEGAVFNATNEAREAEGLPPLVVDDRLVTAARRHSDEMKRLLYFSHESPTPGLKDVRDRVYAAGLTDLVIGENLASENNIVADPSAASDVGRAIVDLLLASEHHRANILDRRYTNLGVGCAISDEGTVFCTQVFSKRIINFKSIKLSENQEKTLKVTLTIKFDDEVGVWVDEEDVHVFQPKEGVVTIELLFPFSKGTRKVALARRVPGTFGPMTSFFVGRFNPKHPIHFREAITDIEVISEEQRVSDLKYYTLEAKGDVLSTFGKLRLADGDTHYVVKTDGRRFKARYGIPASTGTHKIFFVTDEDALHGLIVDTDAPLIEAFRQGTR